MNSEDAKTSLRITYYLKNPVECPLCEATFQKEELLTGRGRLIAGNLSDELRRKYEDSQKFGKIIPLVYPVTVCPECFYATLHEDFGKISLKQMGTAKEKTKERKQVISIIFGKGLDFTKPRHLRTGAASYLLALSCYTYFDKNRSPTIKKGLMSLRLAWLFSDLAEEEPLNVYPYLENLMYEKALRFISSAVEMATKAIEPLDALGFFGPDTDHNFGYDGIIFVLGVLRYKLGWKEQNLEKRYKNFEETKRLISRLYGMGKASKEKPGEILMKTMDFYEELSNTLKEFDKLREGQAAEAQVN